MDQSSGLVVLERDRVASRSVIIVNDPAYGQRIANLSGARYDSRDMNIARVKNDEFMGGVLYQEYNGHSVWMHMAGNKGWVSREMIVAAFHFPFVTLGCKKVFGRVPEWKLDALRYNLRNGFKVETLVEDVYKEGGVFLISMTRDECRWVNPNE